MGELKAIFDAVIHWCYKSPALEVIRNSKYAIPLIQSLHLTGITLVLGTTVVFNLRLTGIGLVALPLKQVGDELWRWGRRGLLLAMASGFFVFIVDPTRYLDNVPFRVKMLTLAVAILFHYTVFKRYVRGERPPRGRLWVAAASLVLWFGVGWAGRAIAFF